MGSWVREELRVGDVSVTITKKKWTLAGHGGHRVDNIWTGGLTGGQVWEGKSSRGIKEEQMETRDQKTPRPCCNNEE